jgi:hypothetical protein
VPKNNALDRARDHVRDRLASMSETELMNLPSALDRYEEFYRRHRAGKKTPYDDCFVDWFELLDIAAASTARLPKLCGRN